MLRGSTVLFAGALALMPATVAAQGRGGQETAKPLAEQGIELYHQGRVAEALQLLLEAEAAFSAPVHEVYIARAHAKLGHLLDAQKTYRKVLAGKPKPGENAALTSIREAAQRESDALRDRIPSLTVTVAGAADRSVSATVDGRDVPLSSLERGVRLDPGDHTVEILAPPGPAREHRVTLSEGRGERLDIVLESSGKAQDPTDPAASTTTEEHGSTETEDTGSSRAPAFVAFGVGALGLGVGTVTGIMALSKASDLKALCHEGHCPPEEAERGGAATTLATVSTVSFVIGAIGIGTGVVLLSVRRAPRAAATSSLHVLVGPGSVKASGSF